MAVEHQIKAPVRKGERAASVRLPKINAQGQERFPAEGRVGRIALRGGREGMGMAQGQEKFPAAGVHVQNTMLRKQEAADELIEVPGEVLALFVTAMDVGEVPAVDLRGLLLSQPLGQ